MIYDQSIPVSMLSSVDLPLLDLPTSFCKSMLLRVVKEITAYERLKGF